MLPKYLPITISVYGCWVSATCAAPGPLLGRPHSQSEHLSEEPSCGHGRERRVSPVSGRAFAPLNRYRGRGPGAAGPSSGTGSGRLTEAGWCKGQDGKGF